MKNHLYLLAALVVIMSMVMFGCAASATIVASEESAGEGLARPSSAARDTTEEESSMAQDPPNRRMHAFEPEGIIIVTPVGYEVEATDFDFNQMASPPGRFFRHVLNFDLYDPDGDKITRENPPGAPIEIWMRWTPADAKFAAKKSGRPTLMIHWGEGHNWQEAGAEPMTQDDPSYGGIARYVVEEWLGDDPGCAWSD
jgi:hypothetical protein